MSATLYQRLGGVERIAAIVEESIDRHAVNPVLAPRFRGKDLPRLKMMGTQLFCAGIGESERCEGRDARIAHAGMIVSEQEFLATMDDIVAALASHGVANAETDEVVAVLFSLKTEVLRT